MIRGRSDDMFKVRGVNMFPSQIEDLLQNVDGVASEYTVTLAHDDEKNRDIMILTVEAKGRVSTENKGTVQVPHRRHPESDCRANQDPAAKRKKDKARDRLS